MKRGIRPGFKTSPEVQKRIISCPTKMTEVLQKCLKTKWFYLQKPQQTFEFFLNVFIEFSDNFFVKKIIQI